MNGFRLVAGVVLTLSLGTASASHAANPSPTPCYAQSFKAALGCITGHGLSVKQWQQRMNLLRTLLHDSGAQLQRAWRREGYDTRGEVWNDARHQIVVTLLSVQDEEGYRLIVQTEPLDLK